MAASSFVSVRRSLGDLVGHEWCRSVCAARRALAPASGGEGAETAAQSVDFYPAAMQEELASMLDKVGTRVVPPCGETSAGAGSAMFRKATNVGAAPVSARGYYRIGEDGRLYLATKSEHYHAPLGHDFPGYRLVDLARKLGIPNATHNNTRGRITRVLEEALIRTANGLAPGDDVGLSEVLAQEGDMRVLNRVLNLETGSLAVEAALKMILARFYRIEPGMPAPPHQGKTPVILVMGNDAGELQANYHGTTVLTQMMRGMWPGMHEQVERQGLWKVVPIRPNRAEDIDEAFRRYETGTSAIAGFVHEIIMMNYGGRRLTQEFLLHAYQLCADHDVPVVDDEIQTCMWAPQLYLFREYGLHPTLVAVGKGFPGGEYPASRILFSSAMDILPQFGALVTNGQEELASLSYLVTMEWARHNAEQTAELGRRYAQSLQALAAKWPAVVRETDGWGHMTTLRFADLDRARRFAKELTRRGLDVSAQTYKSDCPPVVLTKLPLIADAAMIDATVETMYGAMNTVA